MRFLKKGLFNLYVRMVRLFGGVKKNKVVFVSFNGKSYSDNPRSVSEALHEIMPDAQITWIMSHPDSKKNILPSYVRCINSADRRSLQRHLATAGVFVSNFTLYEMPKSKKQLFIQTWHGDKAFKKVLHDSHFAPQGYRVPEQIDGYCDLAVAGSEYGKRQYESAFLYKGKILMEGTPRNDRLVNYDVLECQAIKQALSIPQDTKLLLYAPTLRREAGTSKQKQKIQDLDISATLDLLEKKDSCNWMCLMRAHPAMIGLCGAEGDSRIMDLSAYEDMADLLLISDMLITDYSSCAGDFALLKRPLVLYQADRQEYLEKDRTFYFDIEDSPYFVAQNQQELERILAELTPEKAAENCNEVLRFYGDCETGHASRSVARIIKDWIDP